MASHQIGGVDTPQNHNSKPASENGSHNFDPSRWDMEANHSSVRTIPRPYVSHVYDPTFFKIANPGPLGLISFALTTLVLGFYQCGVGYVFPLSSPLQLQH